MPRRKTGEGSRDPLDAHLDAQLQALQRDPRFPPEWSTEAVLARYARTNQRRRRLRLTLQLSVILGCLLIAGGLSIIQTADGGYGTAPTPTPTMTPAEGWRIYLRDFTRSAEPSAEYRLTQGYLAKGQLYSALNLADHLDATVVLQPCVVVLLYGDLQAPDPLADTNEHDGYDYVVAYADLTGPSPIMQFAFGIKARIIRQLAGQLRPIPQWELAVPEK